MTNTTKLDPRITVTPYGLAVDGRNLVWTLSVPGRRAIRLRADLVGDRIVFSGGIYGDHSLAAEHDITSADRVIAHWRGYVQATDIRTTLQCAWFRA